MPILEPFIETFTGKQFYFLDPKEDQIDIRDIAHSLAFTCRYTGHSSRFYSVAEHSVLVSYLAASPLAGLLHDASEAYITDIASPIKPYLSNYKELEDMLMGKIAAKFGFDYPLDPDIKDCDATQLKTEAKYLLRSRGQPWAHLYPTRRPHGIKPMCLAPEGAEALFLERFKEVRNDSLYSNDVTSNKDSSCTWDRAGVHFIRSYEGTYMDSRSLSADRPKEPCRSYDQDAGDCEAGQQISSGGSSKAS